MGRWYISLKVCTFAPPFFQNIPPAILNVPPTLFFLGLSRARCSPLIIFLHKGSNLLFVIVLMSILGLFLTVFPVVGAGNECLPKPCHKSVMDPFPFSPRPQSPPDKSI